MWIQLIVAIGCGQDKHKAVGDTGGGAEATSDFLGSCLALDYNGTCQEWYGPPLTSVLEGCDFIGGTYSATELCGADERVGTCVLPPVLGMTTTYYYYAPYHDTASAEASCAGREDPGTFSE